MNDTARAMRYLITGWLLLIAAACTQQPSPSERALVSAIDPRADQIHADAQAILAGMARVHGYDQRLARSRWQNQ